MLYLPAVMHQPRRLLLVATLLLGALLPRSLGSHEIPARVAVRAWVVPHDTLLTIFVRVPLEAMRDLEVPERADGSLDLVAVRARLPEQALTWIAQAIALHADGSALPTPRVVATRLALPSDASFESLASVERAFAAAELDNAVAIPWRQAMLDVRLEAVLPAADARLALNPALARLGVRTATVLHLVLPTGVTRTLRYEGDPGVIALDPSWWHSASQFLAEGFRHILGGFDHLLFVFCLVLPIRRWRALLALISAFTIAHSVTLGAAALGVAPRGLWFPPLVEVAIAVSILWLAIENVLLPTARLERRWPVAFGFGLVHGFGFSFALSEQLPFAGGNLLTALATFNIGVELGQLLVVAFAIPVLALIARGLPAERRHLMVWVGSALVAHSAWHWMAERWAAFRAHEFVMAAPTFDNSLILAAMRLALVVAISAAAALAVRELASRLLRPE